MESVEVPYFIGTLLNSNSFSKFFSDQLGARWGELGFTLILSNQSCSISLSPYCKLSAGVQGKMLKALV